MSYSQLLDSINSKDYTDSLTDDELKALFFWSGYSSEEDLLDYEAI